MARLEAFGRQYDDLQTVLHMLLDEYIKEKNRSLAAGEMFEMLEFGRYVADHPDRIAELLRKVRE